MSRQGTEGECGGGSVVIGVKLDSQSRELLTWALVKVAQTGDRVVALHVLHNSEILDRNGNSALLSVVKAFESVLAVYEGFCNLKQIDLKLKICRGSSVRKVLVREALSYNANRVIVGVARNTHSIRSSVSIANYCAKKLPLNCSVLAANNGKVAYQRDAKESDASASVNIENRHHRPAKLLGGVLHWSLSKNHRVLSGKDRRKLLAWADRDGDGQNVGCSDEPRNSAADSTLSGSDCSSVADESLHRGAAQKCRICSSDSGSSEAVPSVVSAEESNDSLALVPVQTLEVASSSISLLIRELPELRPGWPLLRRAILPERHVLQNSTVRKTSVVQWAMRLPARHSAAAVHPDQKTSNQHCSDLDGEGRAIVPAGNVVSPYLDDGELKKLGKELESLRKKYSSTCRLFSYQELVSATSKFSTENMIGKGGSSQVYRGRLSDGKELAVKILKPSVDAVKEFILEIEIITTLHHKNIISLFGFCFDENKLLLIYDFLPKGSLEENLHGKKIENLLCWDERYKVAVGVAEALDYLHNGNSQPVIHRDVKSSNILLADDFVPQLSDFGLATWASTSSSHITCSDVAGTFGYLAPEYFLYGKVNEKIDVYAFGVVLLELLSGRKPISHEYPKGKESLVMWAKPILQSGEVMQLLDPSLGRKYDEEQVQKVIMAASLCLRHSPRLRPRMNLILKLLQGDDEVTKWARLQVNSSEELEGMDDESYPTSNIQSHLNVALLDVEEDSLSINRMERNLSYLTANKYLEDYLQGRCSRSSSFD